METSDLHLGRHATPGTVRIGNPSFRRVRQLLTDNQASCQRNIADQAVQANANDARFLAEMKDRTAEGLTYLMVQKAYTTIHHKEREWYHVLTSEVTILSPRDAEDILGAVEIMSNDLDNAITELDEAGQRIALLEVRLQEARDNLEQAEESLAESTARPSL